MKRAIVGRRSYCETVILLDNPRWPAHGTLFGHLVTTTDLWDLHEFAQGIGLSVWAFDHDHYDLPQHKVPAALEHGAQLVPEKELVSRIRDAGLRVRNRERKPKPTDSQLLARWPLDPITGAVLLRRWREPQRRYHDVSHLWELLTHLQQLQTEVPREVVLAAWFHDAVYDGKPGADEEASAQLAERVLAGHLPPAVVAEVSRLVRSTISHDPDPSDRAAALLCDADLAILGSVRGRYHVSLRDIRYEYLFHDRPTFLAGRAAVVARLAQRPTLFSTEQGRRLWQDVAEANLADEQDKLSRGTWLPDPQKRC